MSKKTPKPTSAARFDALVDEALTSLEQRAQEGTPPSVTELNGVRRLLDGRAAAADLEEANRLALG